MIQKVMVGLERHVSRKKVVRGMGSMPVKSARVPGEGEPAVKGGRGEGCSRGEDLYVKGRVVTERDVQSTSAVFVAAENSGD